MAKGSKSRRRDVNNIANHRLPVSYKVLRFSPNRTLTGFMPLRQFEDRRTWHPERAARPARSFFTSGHRIVDVNDNTFRRHETRRLLPQTYGVLSTIHDDNSGNWAVGFSRPKDVILCVKRKIRREVLHAKGATGVGSGGKKSDRWTEYSSVRCR